MSVFEHFTYAGVSSLEFNTRISGNGTFSAPERDIEKQEVPGRSGDLLIDGGKFKNVNVKYQAYITENFASNISALRSFLLSTTGYSRLEDSYHPEEFRLASFPGPFNPDVYAVSSASFELVFDCMPQRFLKSGEYPVIVSPGQSVYIWNPSKYTAKPVIVATGAGSFGVNGVTVEISTNSGAITIDSDIQECYEGLANRNGVVSFSSYKFPELVPGKNAISAGDGVQLKIMPRWWTI